MSHPTTEPVDTHDPASMAAFMRRRAQCSREFLKLTSEEQIRQFMESWQRNVLPHFAFRFEQGAELIERLVLERDQLVEQFDLVPKGLLEIIQSPSAICAVIGCKNREEHPHVVVGSAPDVTGDPNAK